MTDESFTVKGVLVIRFLDLPNILRSLRASVSHLFRDTGTRGARPRGSAQIFNSSFHWGWETICLQEPL